MPDSATLAPLPTDEWDRSLIEIVERMSGAPLNVHKLLANNEDLLMAWWPLREYVVTGNSLGARNTELVILRTAVQTKQWYEWASHVVRGQLAGLAPAEIECVIEGPTAPQWSRQDAELLNAVDELHQDNRLSETMRLKLSEFFTGTQLLDLIAVHSVYTLLARVLNSWTVKLDEQVSNALPSTESLQTFNDRLQVRSSARPSQPR